MAYQGRGTSNTIVQGEGTSLNAFSTATYPATATGTGTILRADGTNWSATTATYPNTATTQEILYATGTNVIGQLTSANSALAATNAAGTLGMRLFSIKITTIETTQSFTPTTGVVYTIVEGIGGGGGGGGAAATAGTTNAFGGGGHAGAYAKVALSPSAIGASQTVTIGGGGNGGVAGLNPGTDGTATTFGALLSCAGGKGGGGGSAVGAFNFGGAGFNSVQSATGDFKGYTNINTLEQGFSISGTGILAMGGMGSPSIFGGGSNFVIAGAPGQTTGPNGQGYGCGGGGGVSSGGGTSAAGGNGIAGVCIITEYIIA